MTEQCPSREATYVPWSFGEVYACTECGHRRILSTQLQPLRNPSGRKDYDSIYPFPEHERKAY